MELLDRQAGGKEGVRGGGVSPMDSIVLQFHECWFCFLEPPFLAEERVPLAKRGRGWSCKPRELLTEKPGGTVLMRFQIYSCPAPPSMVRPGYCLQGSSGYVCFSLVCVIKFCLLPLLLGACFLVTGSLLMQNKKCYSARHSS